MGERYSVFQSFSVAILIFLEINFFKSENLKYNLLVRKYCAKISNKINNIQGLNFKAGVSEVWGIQYHPEITYEKMISIIKFRKDELHHKDIAYNKGASKKGFYSLIDKVIKTG